MKMKQLSFQVCSFDLILSMIYMNTFIHCYIIFLIDVILLVNAEHPNVVSIFLNEKYELYTTRSWDFLGLKRGGGFPKDSLWKRSLGEDIIIGNLDSGNKKINKVLIYLCLSHAICLKNTFFNEKILVKL